MLMCSPVFAQNWEFGSNLMLLQPSQSMKRDMNNAFGMTLYLGKNLKDTPLIIGGEMSYGNYGTKNSMQEYTFSDGTTTNTNVHVSNDIYNLGITSKLFLRKNKNFNPYLSAKAGWSWFKTTLTIEDPDDPDGCTPLERDILHRDNTFSITGGGGANIDFKTFFTKVPAGKFFIDLSVQMTQGGRITYMNVNADAHQPTPPDSDAVMGHFLNARTQVIHEHHVGYVYSNMLNMVEYKLGFVCRPGW